MADNGGIRHGKMRRPQIPLISEAPERGGTPCERDLLARAAKLPFRGPLPPSLPPPRCQAGQHPPPPPGNAWRPWGQMGKRGRNGSTQLRERPPPPALGPPASPLAEVGCGDSQWWLCIAHCAPLPAQLRAAAESLRWGFWAGLSGNFSWCWNLLAELVYF